MRRDGHGAGHVAAGDGDALVGREDARADVLPGLYPVAYLAVVLHDAADGADGGDAAHDLQPGKARPFGRLCPAVLFFAGKSRIFVYFFALGQLTKRNPCFTLQGG